MKRGFTLLLVIIIFCLLLASISVGVYFFTKQNSVQNNSQTSKQVTNHISSANLNNESQTKDSLGYYNSKEYHFEFSYPKDWSVNKHEAYIVSVNSKTVNKGIVVKKIADKNSGEFIATLKEKLNVSNVRTWDIQEQDIKINDNQARLLSFKRDLGITGVTNDYHLAVQKGKDTFYIWFQDLDNEIVDYEPEIFDQLIVSFKFY